MMQSEKKPLIVEKEMKNWTIRGNSFLLPKVFHGGITKLSRDYSFLFDIMWNINHIQNLQ